MGYRIHTTENKYKVVEVTEGEVRDIKTTSVQQEAQSLQQHLNRGGGFDGWTPEFFLNRIER